MSDDTTRFMLDLYREEPLSVGFLSSFARSTFHRSERVEVDIRRYSDDVAIVIQDLADPGRYNTLDKFTNMDYKPPILKEVASLNSWQLLKRMPGVDPFASIDYQANASVLALEALRQLEFKIQRHVELQASQVLQSGVLSLTDSAGEVLYTIDFGAKATHFPDAAVDWATVATADPLQDLCNLAEVLQQDGKGEPMRLIFGKDSWNNFLKNDIVTQNLDNRRINQAAVNRPQIRNGGRFFGDITAGSYNFECWSSTEFYTHPQTGLATPYVTADSCIMMSNNTRLDATFGAVPRIAPMDPRVLRFVPSRINRDGADMSVNAWFTEDGHTLSVSAATRPLFQPTAIDTYGNLNTAGA